jgi:RNA polymerase sigma-70 factor, ECF subfamily
MHFAVLSMSTCLAPALRSPGWTAEGGKAYMHGPDPLIERAKRGDQSAFRRIFLEHREVVARIVQRFLGPSPEVEDVIQDVFIHVHRSLPAFRGESKFSTWLYRLTANVTKMHIRRRRSRPRLADGPVPEAAPSCDGADAPDEAMASARRVRALYRILDDLPDKKRTVLILHDMEGLDARAISQIVDAPVLTVRTRLFYARKALYAALACDPDLHEVIDSMLGELPGRPGAGTAAPSPCEGHANPARKGTPGP